MPVSRHISRSSVRVLITAFAAQIASVPPPAGDAIIWSMIRQRPGCVVDLVDTRDSDALDTLKDVGGEVDLMLMDGAFSL